MVELLGLLVVLGVAALGVVGLALLRGWVLSWLWAWFIVPLGVPDIGIAHAIGIAAVVGFLTSDYTTPSKDTEIANRIAFGLLFPLVSLGIGAIVHSYM